MEKSYIADLVNLKSEDNNRQLCQCCWLLCTSYGEHVKAKAGEG